MILNFKGTSIDYVGTLQNHTLLSSSQQPSQQQQKPEYTVQVLCESQKGTIYDHFLDPYFKWIDLLAYAIIPFIIMLICTFLIVRVLFRSNRRLNKTTKPPNRAAATANNHNEKTKEKPLPLGASSVKLPPLDSASKHLLNNSSTSACVNVKPPPTVNKPISSSAAVAASRSSKAKHLTYTLIILNCLFFCLVGPLLIVLCTMNDHLLENNKLLINIVYLLAYSNHSFNFVLYGASSPPFRNELFKILRLNKTGGPNGVGGGGGGGPAGNHNNRLASKRNN